MSRLLDLLSIPLILAGFWVGHLSPLAGVLLLTAAGVAAFSAHRLARRAGSDRSS